MVQSGQAKIFRVYRAMIVSSSTNWWLRTPNTGNANNVMNVNSDGNVNNNNAVNSNGVAPI